MQMAAMAMPLLCRSTQACSCAQTSTDGSRVLLRSSTPFFVFLIALASMFSTSAFASGTVYAHEFAGYSAGDATVALQNAIDSGADKVIVSAGMPWVLGAQISIINRTDLEIEFEPGVTVEARSGAFQPTGENLFWIEDSSDITFSGAGASFRMNKDAYQDASQYAPSEHRHALSIRGSFRVNIDGLSIYDSGGDGIYVGSSGDPNAFHYSKDVTIQNVFVDNHHRQGISVISVENLLIQNSQFNNTSGTAPQSGIDFEPDSPDHRLRNVVVRESTFSGNAGAGIKIFTGSLSDQSLPVSLLFDNVTVDGGNEGITISDYGRGSGGGSITFQGGQVSNTDSAAIMIRNKIGLADETQINFNHLVISNAAMTAEVSELAFPIVFDVGAGGIETVAVGKIAFNDVTLLGVGNRDFLRATDSAQTLGLLNIGGTFLVQDPTAATWELGENLQNVHIVVNALPEPGSLALMVPGVLLGLRRNARPTSP